MTKKVKWYVGYPTSIPQDTGQVFRMYPCDSGDHAVNTRIDLEKHGYKGVEVFVVIE